MQPFFYSIRLCFEKTKDMKKILSLTLLLLTSLFSTAQNLTNEGTDFWVGFPEVRDNTSAIFEINISSRTAASGTVEIIGGSGFSTPFTVTPGIVTTISIPAVDAHNPFSEVIIDRAIHVTSDNPVTVYASTFHLYRSEASVCLPVPSLGSDYMITTYPTKNISGQIWESEFVVVCGTDPCQVEIVPTAPTAGGVGAGTPIIVDLLPGEMYQVQSAAVDGYDLTGSTVKATNGTDKFVVFNGHRWTHMQNPGCTQTTADPLYEIAYPSQSWGYEYIALLTEDQDKNMIRVTALEDDTDVLVEGTIVATIDAGEYYDGVITMDATFIESTKPTCVTQAMVTGNCSTTGTGDPSMIVLNSNEQMYLDTVTFYAVEYNGLDTNYASIVTRTTDIGTIELDGVPLAGWTPVPYDPIYSYNTVGIDTGSLTLTSSGCGFLAYTYGLQWAESYFYAAGVRVNSIDDSLSFTSLSSTASGLCDVDTIEFTPFTSGGPVVSYDWDFGDGTGSTEENPIHHYTGPGTYDVELIVEYMCFTDTITDVLTIYNSPTMTSTFTDVTCFGFDDGTIDITPAGGTPGYDFLWSPGGSTSEDLTDLPPGTYDVVVTDQNGCTVTETITITEPTELTAIVSPAGPFEPITTSESMSVTGTPGGTWSADCGACIDPVTGVFNPMAAGNGTWEICYTVGTAPCDAQDCIDIIVSDSCAHLVFSTPPTCFGFNDGSATINVSGGAGVIDYIITDASGTVVNVGGSNTANSLSEGWYYFNVSDDICDFVDSVFIDDPDQMDIDHTILEPLCNGFETGFIQVDTVYNYTGSYDEVGYYWNPNPHGTNGTGTDTLHGVGAGDYTLIINDENGCSETFNFTINEPTPIEFSQLGYHPAFCRLFHYQSGNGVVFAAATGGTPDYTYIWENVYTLENTTSTTWGGLNPGLYEITVTDDNGCVLTEKIELDSLNPIAEFTMDSPQFTALYEGTADVDIHFVNQSENFANPQNPNADTTFFWNFDLGEGWLISEDYSETFDRTYSESGEYEICLVAINKNGCTDTTCKPLIVFDKPVLITPNVFTPGTDNINNTFFFPHVALVEFNCVVVNRWGTRVFEFTSIDDQWDGNDMNGDPCSDGVYFYTYTGESTNGTEFEGQGTVTIVRKE